jgi:hypothetical protein
MHRPAGTRQLATGVRRAEDILLEFQKIFGLSIGVCTSGCYCDPYHGIKRLLRARFGGLTTAEPSLPVALTRPPSLNCHGPDRSRACAHYIGRDGKPGQDTPN